MTAHYISQTFGRQARPGAFWRVGEGKSEDGSSVGQQQDVPSAGSSSGFATGHSQPSEFRVSRLLRGSGF